MQRLFSQLCLAAIILLITGCGTKGDLYLPDDADKQFTGTDKSSTL